LSELDRCFVQFIHPGGEHGADLPGRRSWNTDAEHRRKFLLARGDYVADLNGTPKTADLVFWGEWEPESKVEQLADRGGQDGPRWLHRPYYVRPDAYRGEHQNTDPFVFGDSFLYTLCRQTKPVHGHNRPTFLRDLASGSLVLFGSLKRGDFVLDTVFAVAGSTLHAHDDWTETIRGSVSGTYADVTLRPTYQTAWPHDLRLYRGATHAGPVAGIFSFVPCLPVLEGRAGFERPRVRLEGLITPGLMMGAKATRNLSLERVTELWHDVVKQVLDSGLALGVRFDLPPQREA
jgi:hypothetical protein